MSGVKRVLKREVEWRRSEPGEWQSVWGTLRREVTATDSAWWFYPAIWPAIGRYGPYPTLTLAIGGVETMP